MAKEKVIIDIIMDEERGDQIFILTPEHDGTKIKMPDCCSTSGVFTDEDDLNKFLEDKAGEFDLVKDYRTDF
jgi:hypothetical protein